MKTAFHPRFHILFSLESAPPHSGGRQCRCAYIFSGLEDGFLEARLSHRSPQFLVLRARNLGGLMATSWLSVKKPI